MEPTFNVAICGGGNLAHGCISAIGHFNPHYNIKVLSRRPEAWGNLITGYTKGSSYEKHGTLSGKIKSVSSHAVDVVSDADLILICSPAHTKNEILTQIKPYVKKGAILGTVFGQGAFDLQCQHILGEDLIKE